MHLQMIRLTLLLMGVLLCAPAPAQMEDVRIQTIPVRNGIYMLVGSGGNIGVSTGEDSTFLIDDQFAPLTEKISAAVRAVSSQPIEFVLNTHWHGDHTGGNENLGEAGALIVAHKNVRARMRVEQFMKAFNRTVPASPEEALPVVTFTQGVSFHLNDEEIHAYHVPHAHTDGDSIVHFVQANVVHMGDTFFHGLYPFIDVSSGGSLRGMIAAAETTLEKIDDRTKIIPGHGPLATRSDLLAYRDMLATVEQRVSQLIREGKTLEQILDAKPLADLDATWGGGFMNPKNFLSIVHSSLSGD